MKIAAAILLLAAALPAMAEDYPSPDGGALAKITAASPESCESVVEIFTGSSLAGQKSFASDSHDNGACVTRAAWSPDGKFFALSLRTSGGHQPWNYPIEVFSRPRKRFIDIDSPDAATTSPDFSFIAPGQLEFETTKLPLDENKPTRQRADLGLIGG